MANIWPILLCFSVSEMGLHTPPNGGLPVNSTLTPPQRYLERLPSEGPNSRLCHGLRQRSRLKSWQKLSWQMRVVLPIWTSSTRQFGVCAPVSRMFLLAHSFDMESRSSIKEARLIVMKEEKKQNQKNHHDELYFREALFHLSPYVCTSLPQ